MNLQASETSQETSDLREKRSREREKMRMEDAGEAGDGRGWGEGLSEHSTEKRLKAWESEYKRAFIS